MAALDDFNASVTGAMMGDQMAEQELLARLTTMNKTLTAVAPIFETARQIPIATTLAQMNLANAENLRLGVTPLHIIQQEQESSKSESIAEQANFETQLAKNKLEVARMQGDAMKNPDFETAIRNYKTLDSFLKAIDNQLESTKRTTGLKVE